MNPAVDRYRRNWPKLANTRSRHEKAAKILAVLRSYSQRDLSDLTCLDIGCGSGIISASLAPHFARLVASDLDVDGIVFAHLEYPGTNILHMVSDARFVALADNSCDVIVCSHVYEHVAGAEHLVAEIYRLLKPDGICFFAGPNALRLYEPHLNLWLLHWLPRPLINGLLRVLGRPHYSEHLRNRWQLMNLLRDFVVEDVTFALVRDANRFHTIGEPGIRFANLLPTFVLRPVLALFAPSFNFVLRKQSLSMDE